MKKSRVNPNKQKTVANDNSQTRQTVSKSRGQFNLGYTLLSRGPNHVTNSTTDKSWVHLLGIDSGRDLRVGLPIPLPQSPFSPNTCREDFTCLLEMCSTNGLINPSMHLIACKSPESESIHRPFRQTSA